jgi:hypothetical protein
MRVIGRPQPGSRQSVLLGLVAVFHAAQSARGTGLRRGRREVRLGRCVRGCCGGRSRRGFTTKPLELLAQARLVLGQRLLEQAALLGVHGLGLGAELPALERGQLEGDLLDLGLAQAISRSLRCSSASRSASSWSRRARTRPCSASAVPGLAACWSN